MRRTELHGVEIYWVPIPSLNRANLVFRFVQFVFFQVGALLASLRIKPDIQIASNPGLQTLLPFIWNARIRRIPSVFSVHDVYPDAGITLGVMKNNLIIWGVTRIEQMCLNSAIKIRILSESFRPSMNRLGIGDDKIELIYDWVDTELIQPISKKNDFAREMGLDESFVVLYAGNVGLSQALENLLFAAQELASDQQIKILIVGSGSNLANLKQMANEMRLTNVVFCPFQDRDRLPQVLATADISLVTLQRGVAFRSLPSKSYSILASGRPIIAAADEGSDSYDLIIRSRSGICIEPENSEELVNAIITMKNNVQLRNECSAHGREYAERHHSPLAAADAFDAIFRKVKPI